MVAKKVRGRARFRGDHLVPVRTNALVEALEQKAQEMGVGQVDLMKKIGIAPTFLAVMRSRKQAAVFSTNLKRIADFLGETEEKFRRGTASRSVPPRNRGVDGDVVSATVRYSQALKAASPNDRESASKLLQFLMG